MQEGIAAKGNYMQGEFVQKEFLCNINLGMASWMRYCQGNLLKRNGGEIKGAIIIANIKELQFIKFVYVECWEYIIL